MRVARRGTDLMVRIPKALSVTLGLRPGDEIDVVVIGDRTIGIEKRKVETKPGAA